MAQRLDGRAPAQEILSKGLDAFDGPPRDKVLKGVARFILREGPPHQETVLQKSPCQGCGGAPASGACE